MGISRGHGQPHSFLHQFGQFRANKRTLPRCVVLFRREHSGECTKCFQIINYMLCLMCVSFGRADEMDVLPLAGSKWVYLLLLSKKVPQTYKSNLVAAQSFLTSNCIVRWFDHLFNPAVYTVVSSWPLSALCSSWCETMAWRGRPLLNYLQVNRYE